jgi:hypothetical protein
MPQANMIYQQPAPLGDEQSSATASTRTPSQEPVEPWTKFSFLGLPAEDLFKLHQQQMAAKKERRKVQNRKA